RIKENAAWLNSQGTHSRDSFRRGSSNGARHARTRIVDYASVPTDIDQPKDCLKDLWSRWRGIASRNISWLFRRDSFYDLETLLNFLVIAREVRELKGQMIVAEGGHFIEFAEAVRDCYEQRNEPAERDAAHATIENDRGRQRLRIR